MVLFKVMPTPIQSRLHNFSKPLKKQLQRLLSPLQYAVTQDDQTEPPFSNEFDDHFAEGIYVDRVSGEPLFSSKDKFASGCGWPSFSKPIEQMYLKEKDDYKLPQVRTEVRSAYADSHLGHVFSDGPKELGGLRYCINSAALRFIPKKDLQQEGYSAYLHLFES